ncbi:MAG: class I SAM-dependent methyltransferase [Planctomycetes bacterium]|nr:class I SAM-dependent methyltransferase [Planctomycetota bacterium]
MARSRSEDRKAGVDWWETNPLVYDRWGREPIEAKPGSREYFSEIDERLFRAVEPATENGGRPFGAWIPYDRLRGKRVLDLGCGSGVHAGLLAANGARVAACDLTQSATRLTKTRMEVGRTAAAVARADAAALPFSDGAFDLVWSWGVIHHSSRMDGCVAEIARVLRPGGEARVMVYNRDSIGYWVNIVLLKGLLLGRLAYLSRRELADEHSDGHIAAFLTRRGAAGLFRRCFDRVTVQVWGQRSEALPLPRRLRRALLSVIPDALIRAVVRRLGGFLFVIARKG